MLFTSTIGSVSVVSAPSWGVNSSTALLPLAWIATSMGGQPSRTTTLTSRSAEFEIIDPCRVLRRSCRTWREMISSDGRPSRTASSGKRRTAAALADA